MGLAQVCGRLLDSPTTDGFVSLSSFDVTATGEISLCTLHLSLNITIPISISIEVSYNTLLLLCCFLSLLLL